MEETLEKTKAQLEQQSILPDISAATDVDLLACLRLHHKIAEITAMAERDEKILNICEQIGITLSDQELQEAGDVFRLEHKLLGVPATLAWLSHQRITVEDWSQGIRVEQLTKKLKEHLFREIVDTHYLNNRNDYRRVALSRILLNDLPNALKFAHMIRKKNASFCAIALEHSKDKQAKKNGGFVGICFITKLMPKIAEAIADVEEGEVIGPVQTQLGYHIVRVEKWFPAELSEVREEVLESLFQEWLQTKSGSVPNVELHQ